MLGSYSRKSAKNEVRKKGAPAVAGVPLQMRMLSCLRTKKLLRMCVLQDRIKRFRWISGFNESLPYLLF